MPALFGNICWKNKNKQKFKVKASFSLPGRSARTACDLLHKEQIDWSCTRSPCGGWVDCCNIGWLNLSLSSFALFITTLKIFEYCCKLLEIVSLSIFWYDVKFHFFGFLPFSLIFPQDWQKLAKKANSFFGTICYICRWSFFDWPIHFFFTLGIFAAAHDLKTEWVIIKGISGYADCTASLSKQWVSFASVMAASVMYNILSDTIVFEEWPHYQNPINSSQRTRNEGTVHFKAMKNALELAMSNWNPRLVLKLWLYKLEQTGAPNDCFL